MGTFWMDSSSTAAYSAAAGESKFLASDSFAQANYLSEFYADSAAAASVGPSPVTPSVHFGYNHHHHHHHNPQHATNLVGAYSHANHHTASALSSSPYHSHLVDIKDSPSFTECTVTANSTTSTTTTTTSTTGCLFPWMERQVHVNQGK